MQANSEQEQKARQDRDRQTDRQTDRDRQTEIHRLITTVFTSGRHDAGALPFVALVK